LIIAASCVKPWLRFSAGTREGVVHDSWREEKLAGGKIPGGPPDWPAAADLTAGSAVMKSYDSADKFKTMFRTGKAPDGRALQVMPFPSLKQMSDTDVEALYLYLKALPPRPAGAG
jgi:hypothetical protein